MKYLSNILTLLISICIPLYSYSETSNDKYSYVIINPNCEKQEFEGFGVSLSWWANMCGNWSEEKIDEIIDWLVSPEGLNYRIFRYNIGGGDDPDNTNCTLHHMGNGKGLRAEMEGFKDSSDGPYIWTRDEAQRKILLKIKEKRPDAIFEAFSNSCPWWMTYSGCCAGNLKNTADNLKPEYYEAFAEYLVDVCQHYRDEYEIEFRSLAPFNEPRWAGWVANGSQEGCNFDIHSQIDFIKILSKVIKKSDLDISIAASDESFGILYRSDFQSYIKEGIIDLVGKWNIHTYHAENYDRAAINSLCQNYDIPLWISESGASGSGIQGNLNLSQRLIQDIKYCKSKAWLDWQYIEESGDQWCLVQADGFIEDNVQKTKNYYVRSHFSKYINEGYKIVTSLNENILAAHSLSNDELVLVIVNTSECPCEYSIDLSMYESIGLNTQAVITTEIDNLIEFEDYHFIEKNLIFTIPSKSIITYCIPVTLPPHFHPTINDGGKYLIYPRISEDKILKAIDSSMYLDEYNPIQSDFWITSVNGDAITLNTVNGQIITKNTDDYAVLNEKDDNINQYFNIHPIEGSYYQFELKSNQKYMMIADQIGSSATKIVFSDLTSSYDILSHWGILPLTQNDINSIEKLLETIEDIDLDNSLKGQLIIRKKGKEKANINIYSYTGKHLLNLAFIENYVQIPLCKGIYLVQYTNSQYHTERRIIIK